MKFIHIADVHWNAVPDSTKPWAKEREAAIKDSFEAIISIIRYGEIPLLLIAGDLFHGQPRLKDLNEINQLFMTIPHTKIVIIAGSHDYIKENSHYNFFSWAENVTFLSSEDCSSVYFPNLNIEVHGFSYHTSEILEPLIDTITVPKNKRTHILLAYGGSEKHIPINKQALQLSNFDYIALGGIHKPSSLVGNKAAYPGSLEPLSRKEYGNHGYIAGELTESGLSITHVPLSKVKYISLVINIMPKTTNLELNALLKSEIEKRGSHNIYRFKLSGFYTPNYTIFNFEDLMVKYRIIDIIDETEPEYDFHGLYKEHRQDMIGLYIDALQKPDINSIEKKALYYGINALMQTTNEGKS